MSVSNNCGLQKSSLNRALLGGSTDPFVNVCEFLGKNSVLKLRLLNQDFSEQFKKKEVVSLLFQSFFPSYKSDIDARLTLEAPEKLFLKALIGLDGARVPEESYTIDFPVSNRYDQFVSSFDMSPDSWKLAYCSFEGLQFWNQISSPVLLCPNTVDGLEFNNLSFSSDSSKFLVQISSRTIEGIYSRVKIFDVSNTFCPKEILSVPGNVASWSPNSRQFVYANESKVKVCDLATNQIVAICDGVFDELSWNPSGDKIAMISTPRDNLSKNRLFIWDLSTKAMTEIPGSIGSHISHISWDPTGEKLLFSSSGGDFTSRNDRNRFCLHVLDVKTNKILHRLPTKFLDVLLWSPDGSKILFTNSDTLQVYDCNLTRCIYNICYRFELFLEAKWNFTGNQIITMSRSFIDRIGFIRVFSIDGLPETQMDTVAHYCKADPKNVRMLLTLLPTHVQDVILEKADRDPKLDKVVQNAYQSQISMIRKYLSAVFI